MITLTVISNVKLESRVAYGPFATIAEALGWATYHVPLPWHVDLDTGGAWHALKDRVPIDEDSEYSWHVQLVRPPTKKVV